MIKPYMYKEGDKYWVVYNGLASEFLGPSEKCFDIKAEAEKFLAEKKGER